MKYPIKRPNDRFGFNQKHYLCTTKNDNDEENKGLTPFHIHPHKEWHRYIGTPLLEH